MSKRTGSRTGGTAFGRFSTRRLALRFSAAVVAAAAFFPSVAGADDILVIPIWDVVRGNEGEIVPIGSVTVPDDLIGATCEVAAQTRNQISVHEDNDLLITTGDQTFEIPDFEDEEFVTYEVGRTEAVSETIQLEVRLGPDGVSSVGLRISIDCAPPPSEPTTTQPATTAGPTTAAPTTTGPTTTPPTTTPPTTTPPTTAEPTTTGPATELPPGGGPTITTPPGLPTTESTTTGPTTTPPTTAEPTTAEPTTTGPATELPPGGGPTITTPPGPASTLPSTGVLSAQPTNPSTTAPGTMAPPPAGPSAIDSDVGAGLPITGTTTGIVIGAGLTLIGLGLVTRRLTWTDGATGRAS